MNKKILLISDNKIFGFGGGCLEERKYYDGLKQYVKVNEDEVKVLSIDERFEDSFSESIHKTRGIDVLSRFCGHSTFMYFAWKKYRAQVISYNPDIIVLGRSRMGFIAKDARKHLPYCKIVCNMENIEYDYVTGYFADKKSKLKNIYVALERWCTGRDEKMAVKYSDALDYLTTRDYKRAHELYQVKGKQEMILPICIEKETKLEKASEKKTVVFIGSLGYGSNVNALMDFIYGVWKPIFAQNEDLSFLIGGSNPNEKLKQTVKEIPNCIIFENFTSLEDVVPQRAMVIAPIQSGAGMKVKVAETLSMGLMIAASDEALIGYEKAIEKNQSNGIIRANTAEEFKQAILQYCNKTEQELEQISVQNKTIYQEFYSYKVSRQAIASLCDKMLGNEKS